MPSTKSVLMAAAIAFSGTVSAHMIMATPKPFEFADTQTASGPLKLDGSDYPCKSGNAKFNVQGSSNTMPQGSTQKLSFTGSAVHGGGSCQVSLSADLAPTKNSVFKVIHSIVGGCPARNVAGNLPENAQGTGAGTYDFTIPKDLAAGDYTLAWTWFNKIGNREMYMNCAPITVTGGSGGSGNGTVKRDDENLVDSAFLTKRTAGSLSSLSSAPDVFVARAGNPTCTTQEGKDLQFPNPGQSVEILVPVVTDPQEKMNPAPPVGCGGSTGSTAGGSSSGSTGSNAGGSSGGPSSVASGSTSTSAATLPSNTGGIFVPSAASGAGSSASPTPSVVSTFSPPVVVPSSAPSAAVNGSGGNSGGALSGTCTPEGSFNCVGGTSFQQCASGSWSVVQPMASGTKCTPGQTQTLSIVAGKRSVRFSRGHAHRRHNPYLDTY